MHLPNIPFLFTRTKISVYWRIKLTYCLLLKYHNQQLYIRAKCFERRDGACKSLTLQKCMIFYFIFCHFEVGREEERLKFSPDAKIFISISLEIEVYPVQNPSSVLPKACIFRAFPPDFWHGKKRERALLLQHIEEIWRQKIRLLAESKWRGGTADLFTGQAEEELFSLQPENTHL